MQANFTESTTFTAPGNSSNTANASTPKFTSPPTPSVSLSSPDEPIPRQIKSKSSLRSIRSISSSNHEDDLSLSPDQSGPDKELVRPSILRRLSPGLAARVKLLDGSNKSATTSRSPGAVGRIPEEHIKELDNQHQNFSIKVERRGKAWNGLQTPSGLQSPIQEPERALGSSLPEVSGLNLSQSEKQKEQEKQSEHIQQSTVTENHTPSNTEPSATPDQTVETPLDPGVVPPNQPLTSEEPDNTAAAMSVVEPSAPLHCDTEPETNAREQTDFEKYLQRTVENDERRGRTLERGSRPASISSYDSFHRPGSLYSLSRMSFESQISQLTSISLPQPSTLESTIAGISNSPAAVNALSGSADQIQTWIKRAESVLTSMDANDDVQWAAAGGRAGLDGVDKAITKFESVVRVYVKAIEEVQLRGDIGNVNNDDLRMMVLQMEHILKHWARIRHKLKQVKEQVELAMEWEELWINVLGDVCDEVESLKDLIFVMEEDRHREMIGEPEPSGLDINELETIVEETPDGQTRSSKRLSLGPILDAPPTLDTPIIQTPQDDSNNSNLMALFARMQPLRASLDFLPMRMSMFQSRAEPIFPSACEGLEARRAGLEDDYKTLQKDAETLRLELSEDRWVGVFRSAGIQAQKMFESVERSIGKLQEGLETGAHLNNPAVLSKRIESYEAKKTHYVPAIERVISIIEKGVNDRKTVNGVISYFLSEMVLRMDALKTSIKVMDSSLEDMNISKSHQLRDSISSIITMDSPATGSAVDTPGSSPASSVVLPPGAGLKGASTPVGNSSRRGSSVGSATRTTMSKVRRFSGIPQASSNLSGRKSSIPKAVLASPSENKHTPPHATPTPATRKSTRPQPAPLNRPRWNGSTNTKDLVVGHNFRPVSPNSNSKSSLPTRTPRSSSTIPLPSPFRRDNSMSPVPSATRSTSRVGSRLATRSPAVTATSPTPARSSLLDPPPYSKLRRQPPPSGGVSNAPRNRQSFTGAFSRSVSQEQSPGIASPKVASRPGTSLGHSGNRRISLLPLPRARGKENSASRNKLDQRPPWR